MLKDLGQPKEQWNAWLVTIILRCLDKNTAHECQFQQEDTQLPKYVDIKKFLARRCIAFESSETRQRSHIQLGLPDQYQSTIKQNRV